jgi:heptosyltransferase-2
MKILVIQQKMIGDVLTSSILFEAIKSKHPESQLHYLINAHTFPVIKGNPFIDKFIFFGPEGERSSIELIKLAKNLRKEKYDIVIDAYSKLSSNIISAFSGAKTKISKYKSYTSFLYDHPIKYSTTPKTEAGLAIENRLQLLKPLKEKFKSYYKPKIYLSETEIDIAKSFLEASGVDLNKSLHMISVLGSGYNKTYPFNYMAEVIDNIVLNQPNAQILFNYIPNQTNDAKAIYDMCKETTRRQIFFDVYGKSLRDFLAITSFCNSLIGNEGGGVNMAKALNIPTFTIFSPWIDKDTWSIFDDNKTNVSVHLKDFLPNLYSEKSEKQMKTQSEELYQKFTPDLFLQKLISFLSPK